MVWEAGQAQGSLADDHRAISRLASLSKWYVACIVALLSEAIPQHKQHLWHSCPVYAYEQDHMSEFVAFTIRELLGKASVFKDFEIYIFEGDIKSAFDHLSLSVIEKSLAYWDFPPDLVLAIIAEMSFLSFTAEIGDVSTSILQLLLRNLLYMLIRLNNSWLLLAGLTLTLLSMCYIKPFVVTG